MRSTIDKFHAPAKDAGTRIVHTCGFDSVPLDMGAFLVAKRLAADGHIAARVVHVVTSMRGNVSGGTVASLAAMLALPRAELLKTRDPLLRAAPAGEVTLRSVVGVERILDRLSGEQLPRIC